MRDSRLVSLDNDLTRMSDFEDQAWKYEEALKGIKDIIENPHWKDEAQDKMILSAIKKASVR